MSCVATLQGRTDPAFRLECEARHWLREGHTTPDAVDALIGRIRERRGAAAAEALRGEMRRQWARRAEWLDARP